MTIEKVDSMKIKYKRDKHPMARKYPGHVSFEAGTALRKFLEDLEPEEYAQFAAGTLVFDEEEVVPFFDALQVGDEVGLLLTEGYEDFGTKGPAGYVFEVTKLHPGEDKVTVKNITHRKRKGYEFTMKEIDLYFEEISWAYGCGMADVLMRDGKLFGVPEEVEQDIIFYGEVSGSTETDTSGSV